MPPVVLHRLLHFVKDTNAFWQGKGFGVSAGHSRMRSTRLAGVNGCLGMSPCALCLLHARRFSYGGGGVEGGVGTRHVCDRERTSVWIVE